VSGGTRITANSAYLSKKIRGFIQAGTGYQIDINRGDRAIDIAWSLSFKVTGINSQGSPASSWRHSNDTTKPAVIGGGTNQAIDRAILLIHLRCRIRVSEEFLITANPAMDPCRYASFKRYAASTSTQVRLELKSRIQGTKDRAYLVIAWRSKDHRWNSATHSASRNRGCVNARMVQLSAAHPPRHLSFESKVP
jgi:hypothetical protein